MLDYFCRSERYCFEGVELLRYKIVLPELRRYPKISEFYRDIFEIVVNYCESALRDKAKEEYDNCEIPRKKFNYPPICYSLDGRITYADDEVIFVRLIAETRKRGIENSVIRACDAHAWSPRDQLLMPPKQAAGLFLKKKDIPKSLKQKNGFFVENGKFYTCGGEGIEEIQ